MTVVTVVTKQLCTSKNLTFLKPTNLCDSSYCRDSSDISDSSDSNDSSDSSDQTTLYTKKLNLPSYLCDSSYCSDSSDSSD